MIDKERKNIDSLNIERQQIINQIELQNNLELGAEQITVILQNFKLLFDKATSEEQIQLLQVFIKEIRVNNSKDINERTVKEIVLNLSGLSLYLQEDTKSFEVYYGEVNPIISSFATYFIREGLAMYFDKFWWDKTNEEWVRIFLKENKNYSVRDDMV